MQPFLVQSATEPLGILLLAVGVSLLMTTVGLVFARRRQALARHVRNAPVLQQRLRAFWRYMLLSLMPVIVALGASGFYLGWAGMMPAERSFAWAVLLPLLVANLASAVVSNAFTALSIWGRVAERKTTRHLPRHIACITAVLIAARQLRDAGQDQIGGWPIALALESLAGLIALYATHQQRLVLRQLLRVQSATPAGDPPTLPERLTAWLADQWHWLSYLLIILTLAGRLGLLGESRQSGFLGVLVLSLAVVAVTGLGILALEQLHGMLLGRQGPPALADQPAPASQAHDLRKMLLLRLGRVLRTGGQVALVLLGGWLILGMWHVDIGRLAMTAVILSSVSAVYALWFIWSLVDTLLEWSTGQVEGRSTRIRTLLPFMRNFAFIVVSVLAMISVLSNLGVDVAPLLAGAGVAGIAIGIGAQKLVGDVITGIFIIFEDSLSTGETVEAAGRTGVVEGLTIRTLKLRDGDGALHWIPFSSITTLKNTSRGYGVYTVSAIILHPADTDRAMEELGRIGSEMARDPAWRHAMTGAFSLWGVDQISSGGVVIKGAVRARPNMQWGIGREFNRRIALGFSRLGIAQVQHLQISPAQPTAPSAS